MPGPSPPRCRNAAATRRAILSSARAAFARVGYDGVGVREIAASAGVQIMRQMIGLSALANADPAVLVRLITPLLQQLIEGDGPGGDKLARAPKRSREAR